MKGLHEAAAAVVQWGRAEPSFTWDHRRLDAQAAGAVHAVDGSSSVLVDNGAIWAVVIRAGFISRPGAVLPVAPQIHVTRPDLVQEEVNRAFAQHGLDAPVVRSAEAWAHALQSLAEWQAGRAALDGAAGDDVVLIDGALHGLPEPAATMAERLVDRAADRGIALLGVSKRSGLTLEGVPMIHLAARHGPATTWLHPVPRMSDVWICRLHGASEHVFRVDGPSGHVGRLLPWCKDAVYLGYPYPLAVAHNQVALTAAHAADLRRSLFDEVRRQGGEADRMMADFHEVLDSNVPA